MWTAPYMRINIFISESQPRFVFKYSRGLAELSQSGSFGSRLSQPLVGGPDTHMETRRPPPHAPLPSASLPWNFEGGQILKFTQDGSKVPNKS